MKKKLPIILLGVILACVLVFGLKPLTRQHIAKIFLIYRHGTMGLTLILLSNISTRLTTGQSILVMSI